MSLNKGVKKISAFTLGPIISAFIGFIQVPLITHMISTGEYGKTGMFSVAQGLISMIVFLGLDQAFVREYNENKDRLTTNVVVVPLFFSLIISLGIIIMSSPISQILFGVKDERLPVIALAVMIPFMVIYNLGVLRVRMEERGLLYSFLIILLKTVTLIITLGLFIAYEKSFRSVVYGVSLSEIICGLVCLLMVAKEINLKDLDSALIKRMLRFGIPLVPASILFWAMSSMDKIMIRAMLTFEELGLYEAAFKIVNVLAVIQTCFTIIWVPVAFRWMHEKVSNYRYVFVSKYVSLGMTALCLMILLFKDVVVFILGQNFAPSIYVFPFLLLHPIMYTMSETTVLGISFSRKTEYNIPISVASGGFNIVVNYLLIPIFGAIGAAIGTGLSFVVFFWLRTMISRKFWFNFPLKLFVVESAVVIGNCLIHSLAQEGMLPYIVSLVSLVLVGAYILKDAGFIIKAYKSGDDFFQVIDRSGEDSFQVIDRSGSEESTETE